MAMTKLQPPVQLALSLVENHVPADPDDDWRRVRHSTSSDHQECWQDIGSTLVVEILLTDNQALPMQAAAYFFQDLVSNGMKAPGTDLTFCSPQSAT
jgi:hypothetical protein